MCIESYRNFYRSVSLGALHTFKIRKPMFVFYLSNANSISNQEELRRLAKWIALWLDDKICPRTEGLRHRFPFDWISHFSVKRLRQMKRFMQTVFNLEMVSPFKRLWRLVQPNLRFPHWKLNSTSARFIAWIVLAFNVYFLVSRFDQFHFFFLNHKQLDCCFSFARSAAFCSRSSWSVSF